MGWLVDLGLGANILRIGGRPRDVFLAVSCRGEDQSVWLGDALAGGFVPGGK